MLALPNTSVIAAARPSDDFEGLDKLHNEFKDRLFVVKMELLDVHTVQASQYSTSTTLPFYFLLII